jgi:DUF1009 family protein
MDDGSDLAIISGSGKLPLLIKNTYRNAINFSFTDPEKEIENKVVKCEFERLGFLFDSLKKNRIRRVVMAGAINRPQFDQSKLDEYTLSIMPMLTDKLVQGDNELLSFIADEFKKNGYQIIGASEILPNLILKPGFVCGAAYEFMTRDIKKADKILKLLSPEDIGQGVVIENGLVLGIETLQGTNELLKFVAKTASHLRLGNKGGIFVKRPKANQNLRFDMPVIGPETIKLAFEAGLKGLVVSPHSVIILDKEKCIQTAEANNFFILAEETTN